MRVLPVPVRARYQSVVARLVGVHRLELSAPDFAPGPASFGASAVDSVRHGGVLSGRFGVPAGASAAVPARSR